MPVGHRGPAALTQENRRSKSLLILGKVDLDTFERDGYVVVRGAVSAKVARHAAGRSGRAWVNGGSDIATRRPGRRWSCASPRKRGPTPATTSRAAMTGPAGIGPTYAPEPAGCWRCSSSVTSDPMMHRPDWSAGRTCSCRHSSHRRRGRNRQGRSRRACGRLAGRSSEEWRRGEAGSGVHHERVAQVDVAGQARPVAWATGRQSTDGRHSSASVKVPASP